MTNIENELKVCVGEANGWTLSTMTKAEFQELLGDDSIISRGSVYPSFIPGQRISSNDEFGDKNLLLINF